MTVIRDFESDTLKYATYADSEFFEIFARLVENKCVDTEMRYLFLYQKIESVFEQFLRIASPEVRSIKLKENENQQKINDNQNNVKNMILEIENYIKEQQ